MLLIVIFVCCKNFITLNYVFMLKILSLCTFIDNPVYYVACFWIFMNYRTSLLSKNQYVKYTLGVPNLPVFSL
jgi:hypothetical protein